MKKYTPKPIDISDIQLPEELDNLIEKIAKNVHEVWAEGRIAAGWISGIKRNDNTKVHPCIMPYEDLPEAEKNYDRETALASLKLIYKLGFKIEKNK